MAKKEITLLQMILSLSLITIIMTTGLTIVYSITKEPIAKSKLLKKANAVKSVLPDFQGETKEVKIVLNEGEDTVIVNMAYDDGKLFGAAVESYTNKAYNGSFTIMVGFDSLGNIIGTEVLTANETPGLGDKIDKNKDDFAKKFLSTNLSDENFEYKLKKDGGKVEAITAATVSSRAFCDALTRAHLSFNKAKECSNE